MKHARNGSVSRAAALAAALALFAGGALAQVPAVGLSTVGAQRFGNENLLGFYTPQAGDVFAWSLAVGDFNGDGADDLATGMPFDDGLADNPIVNSGSVVVRYGIPGAGLETGLADAVLRQTPAVDPPEEEDNYGYALAACDFNGDHFDDLAVGVPVEDHVGREGTGGVQVHFGGTGGLPTSGQQFYAQSTTGIPGDAEDADFFGITLACGDFNGDSFDDLVIGVPFEDFGFFGIDAGMVDIVPGTATGLDPTLATELSQDTDGMGGDAELGDLFGLRIATGDFNGDGFDDLAIGSPGEDDAGAIHVVWGGRGGLTTAESLFFMETFLGGASEQDDNFGFVLASGNFDGDAADDLVIGIPLDDMGADGSAVDGGQVCVLYGIPGEAGFDLSRNQFWSEDAIWGVGTSEEPDNFGFGIAAGDFDRDGRDDLAVGHRYEALLGPDDGAATVLMGTPTGLTSGRARQIAAGVAGFPGDFAAHGKSFGWSLAAGDFDGDGHSDLAVGAPFEDENGLVNVGSETVLYGALFADGVENGDTSLWSSAQSGGTTTLEVTKAAKLGPSASKVGLQINLGGPSRFVPATAFVRAGPDRGFNNERTLRGSFFIDPQNVTMSPNPGVNIFDLMTFADGIGAGSKTRLRFELNRNNAVGGWALLVSHFNDNVGALTFSGGAGFALANDPNGHNNRIEFEWRAGNPGHITMWKTRFLNGVPDSNGRVLMLDVDLPGQQNAVINHVSAGVIAGQDAGTSGKLYLDELGFRR